jgi:hypothetical protein
MKSPRSARTGGQTNSVLWNLLTLERLMTGSLVHLVYWFGLGVIALGGFGAIGGAVGTALREGFPMGILLGIALAGAGLLVTCALAIVWRSFCELYVILIQIGEDLRVLRRSAESGNIPAVAAAEPAVVAAPAPASAKRRRAAPDRDQ